MKKVMIILLMTMLLLVLFAGPVLAATKTLDGVEIDENLIIQPVAGKYTVSGTHASLANKLVALIIVKGVYTAADSPTISVDSLVYIDVAQADASGAYAFSDFIPKSIPNCTVLISAQGGEKQIVGYLEAVNSSVSGTAEFLLASGRTAAVTLTPVEGGDPIIIHSDANGLFNFSSVPAASYTLTASADRHLGYTLTGFYTESVDISGLVLSKLLCGDVNSDSLIDFTDLSLLLSRYLQASTEENKATDLDNSNYTDFTDLSVLLSNYLKTAIVTVYSE